MNQKSQQGVSLLEILVVVTIFAILGVVVSRSVLLTLQGSRKTESIVKVRENLSYAMNIIERQVRNADSIPACPLTDPNTLTYTDTFGQSTSFTCVNIGQETGNVASGSARLTNDSITVTACSFACEPGTVNNPASIVVDITAVDRNALSSSTSSVSLSNKIYLRNY